MCYEGGHTRSGGADGARGGHWGCTGSSAKSLPWRSCGAVERWQSWLPGPFARTEMTQAKRSARCATQGRCSWARPRFSFVFHLQLWLGITFISVYIFNSPFSLPISWGSGLHEFFVTSCSARNVVLRRGAIPRSHIGEPELVAVRGAGSWT